MGDELMELSDNERDYLGSQPLGRLATIGRRSRASEAAQPRPAVTSTDTDGDRCTGLPSGTSGGPAR